MIHIYINIDIDNNNYSEINNLEELNTFNNLNITIPK
jgi:hypothetical protein